MEEKEVKCTQQVKNRKQEFRELVSITHISIFMYALLSKEKAGQLHHLFFVTYFTYALY